jgi:hypothetical protein
MSIPKFINLRVLALAAIALSMFVVAPPAIRLFAADPASSNSPKVTLRRCTGITSQRLSQTVVRIYRIFEDGSVEACDDAAGSQGDWVKVGK